MEPKRILVFRRRALGDLVLSLPALSELAARFPDARVDLVMDPPFVEAARAWVPSARVIPFPDRSAGGPLVRFVALCGFARRMAEERYDLVVDFLSTPQTALLTWWTRAGRRIGLALSGRAWAYTETVPRPGSHPGPGGRPPYMADALRELSRQATGGRGAGPAPATASPRGTGERPPRIAIAPGATWSAKAWPIDSYGELARRAMTDWGASVTIFWAPGEEGVARSLALFAPGARVAEPGSAAELGRRLAEFDLLISGDSGARHVAVAHGVPTLAVFGPTDPWTATPPQGPHRWIRYPIACAPCQRAVCVLSRNHCMTRVTPAEVLAAAREMCA